MDSSTNPNKPKGQAMTASQIMVKLTALNQRIWDLNKALDYCPLISRQALLAEIRWAEFDRDNLLAELKGI